jgi:anti-sigma factor RsiW
MRIRNDLVCRDAVEIVTDYLEGRLGVRERRAFERHLAACDGCTNYVEQMRVTIRLTGRLEPEALPPELVHAALEAFRDARRGAP